MPIRVPHGSSVIPSSSSLQQIPSCACAITLSWVQPEMQVILGSQNSQSSNMNHSEDITKRESIVFDPKSIPTKLINFSGLERQTSKPQNLTADYVPGDRDICSGRGKSNWNHAGNIYFREMIQSNVRRYIDAPSKADKTAVVSSIVDELRFDGAQFLKQNKHGEWYDIGDMAAKEKVGHSLRDQVTSINRQHKSKQARKEKAPAKQPLRPSFRLSRGRGFSITRASLRSSGQEALRILEAFADDTNFPRSSGLEAMKYLESLSEDQLRLSIPNYNFIDNPLGFDFNELEETSASASEDEGSRCSV